MNDKSLEVLRQYDIKLNRTARGRGGMLLDTDKGVKLFLECVYPNAFYERESDITAAIADNGYRLVDTYCRNTDGNLVSVDEDGRRYVLKNWFDGRECSTAELADVCDAVRALGKLHIAMENLPAKLAEQSPAAQQPATQQAEKQSSATQRTTGQTSAAQGIGEKRADGQERAAQPYNRRSEPLVHAYERHMKELKMAANYLKNKKRRTDFENMAYKNIGGFHREAVEAVERLNSPVIKAHLQNAYDTGELCHGSFNYHNVLFVGNEAAVTNFGRCRNECRIIDLYQFMRKILEKYDWDIKLAYKLIDEYNIVRSISDNDVELLSALFAFPEKFWKIINYYFNANKAWIPPKSIEKLNLVVEQNQSRRRLLETLK